MKDRTSVTRLVELLEADDRSVRDMAASLIWQRYFRDLLELARRNLDKRVRVRQDEEDVVQSMFHSFCARQGRGEFDLADRDELWRLLVTITLRKVRNAARDHRRECRDVTREVSVVERPSNDNSCPGWALSQMDASTPSPDEAAMLNEALERRLASLENAKLREIALWRLEGYTNREIADRLNCTERSVERRLTRIRHKWLSYDDESSSPRQTPPDGDAGRQERNPAQRAPSARRLE
jgi:RNA polymerase sigma factor (sigma-70 family)